MKQVMFELDSEKCISCGACAVACNGIRMILDPRSAGYRSAMSIHWRRWRMETCFILIFPWLVCTVQMHHVFRPARRAV